MNVFLSYNSLDRPAALRVADALAKRGIETGKWPNHTKSWQEWLASKRAKSVSLKPDEKE